MTQAPPGPAPVNKNVRLVILTMAVTVVLATLMLLYISAQRPTPVPLTGDFSGRPTFGRVTAPNKVVVFQDFKCPHCAVLHDELEAFIEGPVKAGRASLTVLHFPFLADDSSAAAVGAECAYRLGGLDSYREFGNLLYDEQRKPGHGPREPWVTENLLNGFAQQVGLKPGDFRTCALSDTVRNTVRRDAAAYKKGLALGTPGVFVNGAFTRQTVADIEAAMR